MSSTVEVRWLWRRVYAYAATLRSDLAKVRALDTSGLDPATRTSYEVVASAFSTALDGFALPYGDVAVGSWRNAPYVVIQNVGGYIDYPRFFDSEHPLRDAADAEAALRGVYLDRRLFRKRIRGDDRPGSGGSAFGRGSGGGRSAGLIAGFAAACGFDASGFEASGRGSGFGAAGCGALEGALATAGAFARDFFARR